MNDILAVKSEFSAADAYYATKESISNYREQKAEEFMKTEQFKKIIGLIKKECDNMGYVVTISLKYYDCNSAYWTFTRLGYMIDDCGDHIRIRWNMNNESLVDK